MDASGMDEARRIRGLASPGLDRIIIMLLAETGIPLETLIGVRRDDIDLDKGTIRLPAKDVILSHLLLREIRSFLDERPGQTYLLEGRCGKPVTPRWRRCVLERLSRQADELDRQSGAYIRPEDRSRSKCIKLGSDGIAVL